MNDILKDIEVEFCEGYVRRDILIEGDLKKIMIIASQYTENINNNKFGYYLFSIYRFILKTMDHLKNKKVEEVRKHYDLSNDFFKMWLDDSLSYSCAFF